MPWWTPCRRRRSAHSTVDLLGERVRLRAARQEDAAHFAEALAGVEVVQYLGPWAWGPYGVRDAEEFIATGSRAAGVHWTVESLADGVPVGSTGLHDIDHRNRNCAWGIWIGPPDRWGRGYGSEACRLAVGYAFEQLAMQKVTLQVYEGNSRARRTYEKAGFQSEGTLRRHLWLGGRMVDVELMAVFSDSPLYQR